MPLCTPCSRSRVPPRKQLHCTLQLLLLLACWAATPGQPGHPPILQGPSQICVSMHGYKQYCPTHYSSEAAWSLFRWAVSRREMMMMICLGSGARAGCVRGGTGSKPQSPRGGQAQAVECGEQSVKACLVKQLTLDCTFTGCQVQCNELGLVSQRDMGKQICLHIPDSGRLSDGCHHGGRTLNYHEAGLINPWRAELSGARGWVLRQTLCRLQWQYHCPMCRCCRPDATSPPATRRKSFRFGADTRQSHCS